MKTKQEKDRDKKINDYIKKTVADMMTLPFIADIGPKKDKKRGFWNVKPSGDYIKDCNTGAEYAFLYLAHCQRYQSTHILTWIVNEMPRDFTGVEVGFLSFIADAAQMNSIDPQTQYKRYLYITDQVMKRVS
jgi:hypothetical protein